MLFKPFLCTLLILCKKSMPFFSFELRLNKKNGPNGFRILMIKRRFVLLRKIKLDFVEMFTFCAMTRMSGMFEN